MRASRYWILFAACAVGWLIVSLLVAPAIGGTDVYIFRDAGWNLASWGSFESAALIYSTDLIPRLYSHYTPIMPLLFAGYVSIFPSNAYAGTIFNLLVGLLAAGVSLFWVLRQPAGKLRNWTAVAIAVLPVLFITYDRPEALGLVFFSFTVAAAAWPRCRPVLVGLLIAVTFLAHPFVAANAAVWASALVIARNWDVPGRWLLSLRQIAIMAVCAVAPLIPVALLYYSLDHQSLQRFAVHALGFNSGLGVVVSTRSHMSFLQALQKAGLSSGATGATKYSLSLLSMILLAAWSIRQRKHLHAAEWLPIAAGLSCVLISVILFPAQGNYISFLASAVPVGLLIASGLNTNPAVPGLALLLFCLVIFAPEFAVGLVERIEQRPSYQAARMQPAYLMSQLPSPEAIVAVTGDDYDVFKPQFHHLIELEFARDPDHFRTVAGVANCYQSFRGDTATVRPFPEQLNASEFHMIQADPQHLWVTFLGHKLMSSQWGYGCDLYVRDSSASAESPRQP